MSPGVVLRGNSGAYYFLEMDDDAGLSEATFGNQPYFAKQITHPKFTWN